MEQKLLLLLLKRLFKSYCITYDIQWFARIMPRTKWIECSSWHSKKASDNAVKTVQLIKPQSFQNGLDW